MRCLCHARDQFLHKPAKSASPAGGGFGRGRLTHLQRIAEFLNDYA
jgi:hypothetical protein